MDQRRTDEPEAAEEVKLSLPADPAAVRQARAVVRTTLTRWRLPHLVEACVLAVSELVTNALRHGHAPIGVRLLRRGSKVRLDVEDRGEERVIVLPEEPPSGLAESGRGIGIVRSLADDVEATSGEGTRVSASWRVDDER